ncbi:alpha/beta hydrolase [Marinobacter daepoensis]|uniref:Alpha/beta hydrolase n=1 Tax=Marinobacter daepoensis TaxID=262077 RepID=A0ABS3B9X8_9GAMM|nr:YqiA/YcfP family alpha/beta fold hydrolase [Marinobacter daepoensis]MBN7768678.1 alpha/beta hydrolase [Marinobacter daepoensis]MBY6079415.1 alpha/beta hydrolase [Marinobacter daepoensis]
MTRPDYYVFLSHGLESGPGSTKIQALKAVADEFAGVYAESVDHRSTKDPGQRLEQMAQAMSGAGADPSRTVLAGSSMGGWVCAQTSERTPVLGCFMLAPALALPGYPESHPVLNAHHACLIHGWQDNVVPVMPVIELARQQQIETLILADGHRLENSVQRVANEFRKFLSACFEKPNPS